MYKSHGTGTFVLDNLKKGTNVIIEDGVRIFNSHNLELKKNIYIGHNSFINAYDKLVIKDNCWIGPNVYIHSAGKIYIENDVGIGPGVYFLSSYHKISSYPYPIKDQPLQFKNIIIGSNCDIGMNSCILPGTILGRNVQVGAGSVVKGKFPDNVIIAGVPAKIIRYTITDTDTDKNITGVKYFEYSELVKPYLNDITNKITDILKNDKVILGKEVNILEEKICKFNNIDYCIGCSSGTDALITLLLSLELTKKEVIVPTYTFVATVEAICLAGLIPVFVDTCNETSFHTNLDKIKEKITENTGCVIFVHLFGELINLESIHCFLKEINIFLIEDCAQSFGSKSLRGDTPGKHSNGAIFSFFPSKTLGCAGDAGCIVTNNIDTYNKCNAIRNHGSIEKYKHVYLGGNFRISTIQAGILNILFDDFSKELSLRERNACIYNEKLINNTNIILPTIYTGHTIAVYVIICENRDKLFTYLIDNNIECYKYWPELVNKQKPYEKYSNNNYDNSEKLTKKVLALPIYSKLTNDDIIYVCNKINEFYQSYV